MTVNELLQSYDFEYYTISKEEVIGSPSLFFLKGKMHGIDFDQVEQANFTGIENNDQAKLTRMIKDIIYHQIANQMEANTFIRLFGSQNYLYNNGEYLLGGDHVVRMLTSVYSYPNQKGVIIEKFNSWINTNSDKFISLDNYRNKSVKQFIVEVGEMVQPTFISGISKWASDTKDKFKNNIDGIKEKWNNPFGDIIKDE